MPKSEGDYSLTFKVIYSPKGGFDKRPLESSPLSPEFKEQLNLLFDQSEKLPKFYLAFTNWVHFFLVLLILVMIPIIYFTFYVLVAIWLLFIVMMYFSNKQTQIRMRITLNISDLFQEFIDKTGDLFLVNVRVIYEKSNILMNKTYKLQVSISCGEEAIAGDIEEIVVCGQSVESRRKSVSAKKKNKVYDIYKLNCKNVVEYQNRNKANSVMSNRLSVDSIKRFKMSRDSNLKNEFIFKDLENLVNNSNSFSAKKNKDDKSIDDVKGSLSDSKISKGSMIDQRLMNIDLVTLGGREKKKSLFHDESSKGTNLLNTFDKEKPSSQFSRTLRSRDEISTSRI